MMIFDIAATDASAWW